MNDPFCDRIDAFVDGEIPPAERDELALHLASCDRCQRAMHDRMMLQAVAETHAHAARASARVVDLAAHRQRRGWFVAAVALVAAAAAITLVVRRAPNGDEGGGPIAMADAPTRSLEARVPYGPADKYRPYDVARGGPVARESVPLATLAELEKRGDAPGLAAGLLLGGDVDRASSVLSRASESPEVDVERAVVAYRKGRLDEALAILDGVLARTPRHPQAMWDRGLVLRDLGRTADAAAAFDAVAALGESGWSAEAKGRADALRAGGH
jgi:hypothetical protein